MLIFAELEIFCLFWLLTPIMILHDIVFSKILTFTLTFTLWSFGESVSSQLPCDFLHSVNISNGKRDDSGGILHDGVYYEEINYATVDYSYDNGGKRITVSVHTRGCVCQVMNCVWLCCVADFVDYDGDYPTCSAFNVTSQLMVDMIDDNGETEQVDLNKKSDIFKVIWRESCGPYDAKPHEWNMNSVMMC